MSPNDVELVRVYTKELGGKISDTTLPASSGFEVIVEAEAGSSEAVLSLSLYGSSKRTPIQDSVSILDCKRLEIERGEGGDHDLPYHFAIPHVWPQVRAWTEILVQIQRGELQP